jgi:hypothetical protein
VFKIAARTQKLLALADEIKSVVGDRCDDDALPSGAGRSEEQRKLCIKVNNALTFAESLRETSDGDLLEDIAPDVMNSTDVIA